MHLFKEIVKLPFEAFFNLVLYKIRFQLFPRKVGFETKPETFGFTCIVKFNVALHRKKGRFSAKWKHFRYEIVNDCQLFSRG